ncbi:hypothetical protein E3J84_06070 [Candidatus Aerophobetes bacterium]|uniref:Uncharacterized protein n=1 Tax=Aerophobetes bacterium TaxID=2030807 RepID=A0A523RS50_UNCAE|nr:MAG: hypothetical protein E3J84_06070 [Candidatus Aerophobetes bacterium]
MRWEKSGTTWQVYVYRATDGNFIGTPVNSRKEHEGISYVHGRGEFYLEINGIGEWSNKVEEGRNLFKTPR